MKNPFKQPAVPMERPSGVPGVQQEMDPEAEARMLTRGASSIIGATKQRIGKAEIARAATILQNYKSGKECLESRIVEDELWWTLRHWEAIKGKAKDAVADGEMPASTSAWLQNSLVNKHADAMDNIPEPIVLPREKSDADSAKILSEILPVIMDNDEFESKYSDESWEKIKHGTGIWGCFWDSRKENGLGDISIQVLDILKIFWEPGVTDIQASSNLFIVDLVDESLLNAQYPQYAGHMKDNCTITLSEYLTQDYIDNTNKSLVVDWYYKVQAPGGRTLIHYCKFVGDQILYASENDPFYQDRGYYDHGMYPVVFDCLFPEKGTPVGYGYISICKDPQMYIDKLSSNILENAMMATKKRFFVSGSTNINEDEFLDWTKPIVHVEGALDDTRVKEIVVDNLNSIYVTVLDQKINEMKETAANRDVSSGGSVSGVTAASAIAALQEAGNKNSRDFISASYRSYTQLCKQVIELIRQFYDEERAFRITLPNGTYEFLSFSNQQIKDQLISIATNGQPLFRKPVFDLKIKAQKRSPFSRMEQNELSKTLYQLGVFNPVQAQPASIMLDMMDFEGIESVKEKIQQGQTLQNMLQQVMMENAALKASIGMSSDIQGADQTAAAASGSEAKGGKTTASRLEDSEMEANKTPMMKRAEANAKPDVSLEAGNRTAAQ